MVFLFRLVALSLPLALVGLETVAFAQSEVVEPATTLSPTPMANPYIIRRDTPVELMATSEIRSDRAPPGSQFKLRVNKPLVVEGVVVVPIGAIALAEVVDAESSGGLGKKGKMTTRLLHMKVGDALIPLEGEASATGTGAGSAGVAVIFTGVTGLFHRGNNAKIKAGELVTGFVAKDIALSETSGSLREVAIPIASTTQFSGGAASAGSNPSVQ